MNIVVVGSLNMDVVIPVNPYPNSGETVIGGLVSYNPGGKGANQAVAAAKLGASVTMCGVVGRDEHGDTLCQHLERVGVNTQYIGRSDKPTGLAFIHL